MRPRPSRHERRSRLAERTRSDIGRNAGRQPDQLQDRRTGQRRDRRQGRSDPVELAHLVSRSRSRGAEFENRIRGDEHEPRRDAQHPRRRRQLRTALPVGPQRSVSRSTDADRNDRHRRCADLRRRRQRNQNHQLVAVEHSGQQSRLRHRQSDGLPLQLCTIQHLARLVAGRHEQRRPVGQSQRR